MVGANVTRGIPVPGVMPIEPDATGPAWACDLPLSTTYRKLYRLEAVGRLEEHARLDPDRNYQSEFATAAVDVSVVIDAERGLRGTVSDDGRDSCSFPLAD